MKLGIGMIVKNESRDVVRCLDSIKGLAHTICVIDTGSTDDTLKKVKLWAKANNENVYTEIYLGASHREDGQWLLDDFSKARNRFVEYLDRRVDVLMWMDADDVLLNREDLRLTKDNNIYTCTILHGSMTFAHHRIWRTEQGVRFEGAVHEYPKWNPYVKEESSNIRILHDNKDDTAQENSGVRNFRILKKEVEKGTPSNRTLFYYANTLRDAGKYTEAIPVYERYLAAPFVYWDEMMYAYLYLMRCYRATHGPGSCVAKGMEALARDQRFSEISMEIAYGYFDMKDYDRAIGMAYYSLQKPAVTMLFLEKDKYEVAPWKLIKDIFLIKNGMK